jgi:hypothetical protein
LAATLLRYGVGEILTCNPKDVQLFADLRSSTQERPRLSAISGLLSLARRAEKDYPETVAKANSSLMTAALALQATQARVTYSCSRPLPVVLTPPRRRNR